jgi:hypothetical protein
MKNQYSKLITCLLLVTIFNISKAQSLFVDVRFFSGCKKNVAADYKIICNDKVIKTGRRRKLKLELSLNNEYTLLITKEGFHSKSVRFSTNTQSGNNFSFVFDAILNKVITQSYNNTKSEDPYVMSFTVQN